MENAVARMSLRIRNSQTYVNDPVDDDLNNCRRGADDVHIDAYHVPAFSAFVLLDNQHLGDVGN